ncbi:MAG: molybdate ABC transporter substrate-binding protein [Oscillospiraceae bacterium]|nr:molybdate ABC transporter substrate-binding protein [Oscillospiraceae bacterium]
MKKGLALLLALAMIFALAACGSTPEQKAPEEQKPQEEQKAPDEEKAPEEAKPAEEEKAPEEEAPPAEEETIELIVFAAASMTETLTEIKALYEAANPGVTITYNFDSSGTLKTQIQEGADCDLFISAAPKQMNALDASCDAEKNPDGLDFVLQGSRINLLENKVALVVPEGNPKGVESFDQLVELLKAGDVLFSMGNSDVPVGQYTQKIFAFYELNEEELAGAGLITYGTNVKEVTTQVKESSVDCGVVYATDAFSAGLTIVDTATKDMCGQVIYPAAVLNVSQHPEAAQAFLDYLTGPEATAVFEAVGFSPMT